MTTGTARHSSSVFAGFKNGAGGSTVTGVWTSAQRVGDLNVCTVDWNDATSTISSITDTSGNTYTQVGTAAVGTGLTEAMYYAQNIAAASANANTVTVTLSASPSTKKLNCAEYSGAPTSGSFDTSNKGTGTSATPASGNVTTAQAGELLVGGTMSSGTLSAVSPSYTSRVNGSSNDLEDRTASAIGAYGFSPTLSASANWAAIVAAFKVTSTTPTYTVTLTGGSGTGNGSTTINGGSACLFTNGIPAGNCSVVVSSGATVQLLSTPNSGTSFSTYIGGGCSTNPNCLSAAITSNTTIAVNYVLAGVQNYYVGGTGASDANDGLASTVTGGHGPWSTLQKANSSFVLGASGTTVNVANGTYSSLDITRGGTSTARLTYVCTNGTTAIAASGKCINTTTVSFANIGFFVEPNVSYVTIQGFDIGNNVNMGAGIGISGGTPAASSIYINKNYVHDLGSNVFNSAHTVGPGCPESGAITGGAGTSTDLRAVGNFVKNFGVTPALTGCSVAQGIYFAGANEVYQDNLVIKVPTGGIQVQSNQKAIVSNNTVINSKECIIIESVTGTPGLSTYANNYCAAYTVGAFFFTSNVAKCDNSHQNLFTHNMTDGSLPVFTSGPFFCDQVVAAPTPTQSGANFFVTYATDGSGNYQLKSTSAGIDAGVTSCILNGNSPCVPATDIVNVARPARTAWDIGAYELP